MVNCGIGGQSSRAFGGEERTAHWVKTIWTVIRKWRFCPDYPPWTRPLNTVASRGSNQVAKAKWKFGSLRWPHLHYAPHWGPTFWPEEFFVLLILRIWISFGYNSSFFFHSFNTVLLSIYYELVIKIVAIDTIVNKHRHNPCPPTKILLCSLKYFFLRCKIARNQQIRFKTNIACYLTVARGGMVSCIPFPKYCFSHSRRDKRSLILSTDPKAGKKLIPQVQFQGPAGAFRNAPKRDSSLQAAQETQSCPASSNYLFSFKLNRVFLPSVKVQTWWFWRTEGKN